MKERFGNYVEGISRQKLFKQGFEIYLEYFTDKVSQQNIITKLKFNNIEDYVYTQRKDVKKGLFKVTIYAKYFRKDN